MEIRVTRARKVHADGMHNAFTGIAAGYGKVFITFRSGRNHISPDGAIKVISSEDRETWKVAADERSVGVDLRDPKIVQFREKLMVFCGECHADKSRRSMIIQTSDGVTFNEPVPVGGIPKGRWLWHVQAKGDRLYGTAYCVRDGKYVVSLFGSDDGLTWEEIVDFPIPGNEVYIDFDAQGMLWALVRNDRRGGIPTLCTAEPPYSRFGSVIHLPMRLQGPMVKRLANGCVIICRQWNEPGRRNLRTEVFWLEDGRDMQRIATLPSGGDTSYAGWLDLSAGQAVVSYYSSHEHKMDESHANDAVFSQDQAHAEHSTAADIFLADISYI